MSNRVVGIIAVVIVFLLIAGVTVMIIAGRGDRDTTQNGSSPTSTTGPVTLTVWRTFDDDLTFKQSIVGYLQDKPNIKIDYVKKDLADYEVQLLNALAAGTGPDIASIDHEWIPRHTDKLVPLPDNYFKGRTKNETRSNAEFYADAFAPIATKDNVIEDKVYGMPLYIDSLALYVNTALWNQARYDYRKNNATNSNFDDKLFRKPPANWNDMLELIPYLVKKDASGNITQAAIALGTGNNVPFSADMLSLLMLQNGTKMVDEGQKQARFNTFQNDASGNPVYTGTNALDFYTSFARDDKANYTWNTAQPDALQAFIDGKLAIFVGYQYITQTLKERAPTLQYDVYAMPQVKDGKTVNYGSYWTETVTNNSKHADVAWDFVLYMASRPNTYLKAAKRSLAIISDSRPTDVFSKQVMTATHWAKGKDPEKADQVFNAMIENITVKKQPLQATIDNAATEVSDYLQKE